MLSRLLLGLPLAALLASCGGGSSDDPPPTDDAPDPVTAEPESEDVFDPDDPTCRFSRDRDELIFGPPTDTVPISGATLGGVDSVTVTYDTNTAPIAIVYEMVAGGCRSTIL